MKRYLLPLLVNAKRAGANSYEKSESFDSFKFGDVQMLDITNFSGGATSLDSFLEAYKTSERKCYFPYEWFDCLEKLNESFFKKLCKCNPLESEYTDYENLLSQASKIMNISSVYGRQRQ